MTDQEHDDIPDLVPDTFGNESLDVEISSTDVEIINESEETKAEE